MMGGTDRFAQDVEGGIDEIAWSIKRGIDGIVKGTEGSILCMSCLSVGCLGLPLGSVVFALAHAQQLKVL